MANFDLKAVISADDNASGTIKSFSSHLQTLEKQAGEVSSKFNDLAGHLKTGFTNALKVAGVAATGLTAMLYSSVKSAEDAEFANKKMTEMLKNSGKVTNEQIEDLRKYAETMQFKLGIDDENIKQGIAMLGTFKLQGETIKKTIPILGALANAYKKSTGEAVSLQEWAIKIGKAEALPELAGMLRRIGIVFDDNQLKMLKMASEEERVEIITKELTTEFGNGTWTTETFGGKIVVLGLMFDEMKEKIGNALLQGLTPLISKFQEWVSSDQAQAKIQQLADDIGQMTVKAVEWITNVAVPWIQQHWPAIKEAIKSTTAKIGEFIGKVMEFVEKHPRFTGAITAIAASLAVLSYFQIPQTIGAIASLIGTLGLIPTMIIIGIAFDAGMISKIVGQVRELNKIMEGMPREVKIRIWADFAYDLTKMLMVPGYFIKKVINALQGKASGGPVASGTPYIVGEAGPEIFVPSVSGRIVPNNQISNSVSITFTGNITNTSNASLDAIGQRIGRQIQLAQQGI